MKTLAYTDRKNNKNKRSWEDIKKKLKDEFIKTKVIAKETYQGIKSKLMRNNQKKS